MTTPLMAIAAAIHEARKQGIEKMQYQLLAAMPLIHAALRLGYKHTQVHACLESQGIEWNINYYRVLFNRARAMSNNSDDMANGMLRQNSASFAESDISREQEIFPANNCANENASVRTLVSDELVKARAAASVDYTRTKRRGGKK